MRWDFGLSKKTCLFKQENGKVTRKLKKYGITVEDEYIIHVLTKLPTNQSAHRKQNACEGLLGEYGGPRPAKWEATCGVGKLSGGGQ